MPWNATENALNAGVSGLCGNRRMDASDGAVIDTVFDTLVLAQIGLGVAVDEHCGTRSSAMLEKVPRRRPADVST